MVRRIELFADDGNFQPGDNHALDDKENDAPPRRTAKSNRSHPGFDRRDQVSKGIRDDNDDDDDDDMMMDGTAIEIGQLVHSLLVGEGQAQADAGIDLGDSESEGSDDDDDDSLDGKQRSKHRVMQKIQGKQCQRLWELLHNVPEQRNIRTVLSPAALAAGADSADNVLESQNTIASSLTTATTSGRISSAEVSEIASTISNLMTQRVDAQDLLPATQDDKANEQVMQGKRSNTITLAAMQAARLYAHLASRPGAWASSFLELQGLTSLTALSRRWSLELSSSTPSSRKSTQGRTSTARQSSSGKSNRNSSAAQPRKKQRAGSHGNATRQGRMRSCRQSTKPSIDDSINSSFASSGSTSAASPHALGFAVAKELANIPFQKEFSSWTSEAREALLETLVVCYVTCASCPTAAQELCSRQGFSTKDLLDSMKSAIDATLSRGDAQHRIETCKVILRQTLPYVTVAVSAGLPGGEKGRFAAQEESSKWIRRMLLTITKIAEKDGPNSFNTPTQQRRRLQSTTPGTTTATANSVMKRTPKSHRKKRRSADGRSRPVLTSPALKRNGSRGHNNNSRRKENPGSGKSLRPLLSIFVGFFQKIATFRTGLEKARVRHAILSTINSCLGDLPIPERTHILQFVIRLAQSKVSVHRLMACEWMSHILCQPWLIRDHRTSPASSIEILGEGATAMQSPTQLNQAATPDTNDDGIARTPSPADPTRMLAPADALPHVMFEALQGRLVDRIATVRARAASALGTVANRDVSNSALTSANALANSNSINEAPESDKAWMVVDETLLFALRKRALQDESALVRKAAISSFGQLLLMAQGLDAERNVAALCELTQDKSLLTRTAAAQALTTLLLEERRKSHSSADGGDHMLASSHDKQETWNKLEEAWSSCVLPMVLEDDTTRSQQRLLGLVNEVLIAPFLTNLDGKSCEQACRILGCIGASRGSQGSAKNGILALGATFKQLATDDPSRITTTLVERLVRMAHRSELDAQKSDGAEEDGNLNSNSNTKAVAFEDDAEYTEQQTRTVAIWTMLDTLVTSLVVKKEWKVQMIEAIEDCVEGLGFCLSAWRRTLKRLKPHLRSSLSPEDDRQSTLLLRVTLRSSLVVLSHLAFRLDVHEARECSADLTKCVERFAFPPDVIGSAVTALASLYTVSWKDTDTIKTEYGKWIRKSLAACELELTDFAQRAVKLDDHDNANPHAIGHRLSRDAVRALHTVGELTMLGFKADDDKPKAKSVAKNSKNGSNGADARQQGHTSPEEILRSVTELPSRKLQDVVMALLPAHLPGAETVRTPESIRAHAFVVLGKMCLRDETLAKTSLNLFARELHPATANASPAVQSNALLVLGDLCIRYTNMADRYLPVMASCLQSGVNASEMQILKVPQPQMAIVRKHAILMLSSLLLQDYVKWRGLLFHRFLVASSDDDDTVAQLAESVLSGPLWVRYPKLFFNQFVESIFVLNRCTAHPIYVSAATNGDGGSGIAVGFDGIDLRGAVGEARRRLMYDLMLSKLSDEEKIGITARLAKEVLGSASSARDGDLALVCRRPQVSAEERYEGAVAVLNDSFYILTHKMLKVGKVHDQDDEMEIVDPNMTANPGKQIVAAKSRLLSNISRKHLIEIILPILCNLKAVLQASCSPLLKDLMSYLVYIFRNYKSEVKEFLTNDPTLLKEIEYDARQHATKSKHKSHAPPATFTAVIGNQ